MISYVSVDRHKSDHLTVDFGLPGKTTFHEVASWHFAFDLLGDAPVAMALVKEGKILALTEALAKMIGRPVREIEGKCFWRYLHPEDIPYIQKLSPDIHRSVISRLRQPERDRWVKMSFTFPAGQISDSGDLLVTVEEVTELRNLRLEQCRALKELMDLFSHSLVALGKTLAMKDPYTQLHHVRVARLALAMSQKAGLPDDGILTTAGAAFMHDIGKIAVPSSILCKPGRLTREEYEIIKIHPQVGASIVGEIPFTIPIRQTILQHHERLDGSGYPRGLKGEQILVEARILAVADVMEALTADRPYRSALSHSMALEEIAKGRSTKFDPVVVDICQEVFREGFSFHKDNLENNPDIIRYFWKKVRTRVRDNAAGKFRF